GASVIAATRLGVNDYGEFYQVSNLLNRLAYAAFFVYFIKLYMKERNSSNKYYLSFLHVFAGVVFILPVLMFLVNIISSNLRQNDMEIVENFFTQSIDMTMLSNVLL